MKHRTAIQVGLLSGLLSMMAVVVQAAGPVGTGFQYQGRLKMNGNLVAGATDLRFSLWKDATSTDPNDQIGATIEFSQVADPNNPNPVVVERGLFQVELDFGVGAFDGEERWLEIQIRHPSDPTDTAPYAPLTARQKVAATPYAIYSVGQSTLSAPDGDPAVALAVNAYGRVGIGTTEPGVTLDVAGDFQAVNMFAKGLQIRDPNDTSPVMIVSRDDDPNALAFVFHVGGGGFGSYPIQLGRDNAGNRVHIPDRLCIGTRNTTTNYRLALSAEDGYLLQFGHPSTERETWNVINTAYGSGGLAFHNASDSAFRLFLAEDGNVGIGYTAPSHRLSVNGEVCADDFVSCSDSRFKQNVDSLGSALDLVTELQPVRFNWRCEQFPDRDFSEDRQIGFIAQDVLDVVPEIVSQGSDGYYAVDYGRLTPVLAGAVQQLHGVVEEQERTIVRQEADIAALQARLQTLESLVAQLAEHKLAPAGRAGELEDVK